MKGFLANAGVSAVRGKAEQDLAGVQSRIVEAESRLVDLRGEEKDLLAFLKRLDRYQPEGDAAPFGLGLMESGFEFSPAALDSFKATKGVIFSVDTRITDKLRDLATGIEADKALLSEALAAAHKPLTSALEATTSLTSPEVISSHPGAVAKSAFAAGTARGSSLAAGVSGLRPSATSEMFANRRGRRMQVNNYAFGLLEAIGMMPTKRLVDHVRTQPTLYSFLGSRPEATLSSYLSRDPRFEFDRENGGWLIARNSAAADADQDSESGGDVQTEGSVS